MTKTITTRRANVALRLQAKRGSHWINLALLACWLVFAASAAPLVHSPHAAEQTSLANEAPFLAENGTAMTKMMKDMSVQPTGDVDIDFVAMMVPHHQGAIDMALAVLRHGRNEKIRRLAQEIIVTQQEEIAAMRLAVGEDLPHSLPSPTSPEPATER